MVDIASHRGGAQLWPENSPTAFRNTLALGTEQIEFDVQMTRDGEVVVFHDATLDRTTDGEGPVVAHNLQELRRFTLNGTDREHIMTLVEAVQILKDSSILLRCEFKAGVSLQRYPQLEERTVEILAAQGLLARTVFTSFQIPTLVDLLDIDPPVADFIWLVSPQLFACLGEGQVLRAAHETGVTHLGLHHADLSEGVYERMTAQGVRVGAWAVHEEEAIRRMLDLDVTVFTTDRPDIALSLRRQYSTPNR